MPASTLDPVTTALRSALSKSNSSNIALDSQIAGSTKKSLLTNIEFETAGTYQSSILNKLKSKYIVLKSSDPNENNKKLNKSENMGAEDGLTLAKYELYPLKSVQLGWNNADWSVGAGMVNMGNTCYLNSTLQALFHVPALVNWLMSEKQHMAECDSSGGQLCVICAMRKTLQESQQRNINSIRPYLIYNKLRVLCRNLIPGRQEDAHEFLRYLVEAMEKAYLGRFKNSSEFDARIKETTPLHQILGGYLRSAVRCLECGNVSTTFQHFQDLMLDIRKVQTLDEALEGYFSKEKLDDDSYHCETCKRKVPAWKQFSLERPPMVLCVQLKRFSISNNKITKHVQFRQRLDMTKYVRRRPVSSLVYRLVALVTHMGSTAACGHYTAIAQASSGNYYQFDDSVVKPISHQGVFSTHAYIMLYELECPPLTQTNGKIKMVSPISTVTQLDIEESPTSTTQTNGNTTLFRSVLPVTKLQKPIGLGQNGVSIAINGNGNASEPFSTTKVNNNKPIEKEHKPISLANQTPITTNENMPNGELKASQSTPNLKINGLNGLRFSNSISSPNVTSTTNENSQSREKCSSLQSATKLVPYDMDDSSNCSEESHNNINPEISSHVSTNGKVYDWKVTSSTDNSEPSSTNKKNDTVSELLKMSHNGYSAPVISWNGTKSQLDEEISNEKRLERKRTLLDTSNSDCSRPKHQKLNLSNNPRSNPNYNPVQEYHNSKNWNSNNSGSRYRQFYNSDKRHRNDRRTYHHKNYHKNHRFRH